MPVECLARCYKTGMALTALLVLLALVQSLKVLDVGLGILRMLEPVEVATIRESPFYEWVRQRSDAVRVVLGNAFRAPFLICAQAAVTFVLVSADAASGALLAAATASVLVGAGMIAFYLAAVVVARRQHVDIERLSGFHYARTAPGRRDADNAAHPIVVILAVSGLLVLAYAGLYRALTLADPGALTTGDPLDAVTAIYFSAVTMATVGFGDISAVSDAAQIAVVSQIGVGITAFSLFINSLVSR